MKQILIGIGVVLGLLVTVWASFTYLERYALCEDVKKVDQKTEGIQKQMDFKFKALDLKTTEDRIYDTEKRYGKAPRDFDKQADLEKLKKEREQILREMEDIKKK